MSTEECIIFLLRSFLRKEPLNTDLYEFNALELFHFSTKHKIENITLAAIKKANIPIEKDLLEHWEGICDENTVQLMFQESEKERLVEAFNEANIEFLPLKGWFLRDVYPKKEYRFMSDLDVLFHISDRKKVSVLLKELEYSGGIGDYGSDDSYYLEPFIHLEVHIDMVSVEHEKWYEYYKCIWDKVILVSQFEYKLNWNDFYIYMMINYLKDYTLQGVGIRPIIDLYYFLDKYRDQLDFDYINNEFVKLGVSDLAQQTLQLVEDWFGENPKILCNDMGDKLLNSGIYGTSEELVQHRYDSLAANVSGKEAKKVVYLLRRAFPEMKIMKYKYPILNKAPLLLPFCWGMRLFRHSDRARMEIEVINKVKNK